MKKSFAWLALPMCFIAAAVQAELAYYTLNVVVDESSVPGLNVGETAEVRLVYDTDSSLMFSDESPSGPWYQYQDLNFTSFIEVDFPSIAGQFSSEGNGFTVRVSNYPDYSDAALWTQSTSFSGFDAASTDGLYTGVSLGVQYDSYQQASTASQVPLSLPALVPGKNAFFVLAYDTVNQANLFVLRATDIVESSPKSVEVNISSDFVTVPAAGGKLKFSRTLTNVSGAPVTVRTTEYVSFPDGFIFSRKGKHVDLLMEASLTKTKKLTVPAGWPAGEYTYTWGYVNPESGEMSTTSTTFTKLAAVK